LNLDLPNDELGRLASTFDSMLGRIEESFQRQRQFTGDAAHELRTPLALMRSQIDLALTQADTPEELREALQALDGDVGQMTTLVGTLLALARADAGALTPSREPVDLADLASDVCDQYAPIASQNGLTLTCVARPVGVQADADMVLQVIVNLVDNAIKNTPEGGTITIRTGKGTGVKAQETGGGSSRESRHDPQIPDTWPLLTLDSAFVQVTDTGVGIPAEHLPRIFDRFYRVDAGRTRNKGGIGLGLAISQSIAQVHGGTLSAASAPGKGSTFTLTLPA
jgi:signal transduction histidine kinase